MARAAPLLVLALLALCVALASSKAVQGRSPLAIQLTKLLRLSPIKIRPGEQCSSLVKAICDEFDNGLVSLCNIVCSASGCGVGICEEEDGNVATCTCYPESPPCP